MHWLLNNPSIVMLHYVSDDPSHDDLKPWSISHKAYTRFLDYLVEHKYQTLVFQDIIDKSKEVAKSKKNIIITFDDCPKQLLDFALPELIKRGMKAVFYVSTAHIGGYNTWGVEDGTSRVDLVDENDIKQLVDSGMEIGSHADSHVMLEEVSEQEAFSALKKSKEMLEQIIGKDVLTVAYPYGSLPKNYVNTVQQIGYKLGLGVFVQWQTKYALRRWRYDDTDDINSLRSKLSPMYGVRRALSDKWDIGSKKILRRGYLMYRAVKDKIVKS